ncbi:MAG: hypothetical protein ACFCUQ_18225 [Kiloniellales bacterium]
MNRPAEPATAPLDRPLARVVAGLVVLLVLAALGWMHREDLFPPEAAPIASDDPVALCFAERAAEIDKMLQEGTFTPEQASLFKSRAEALCQDQHGGGSGPPAIPAQ